jgi:hypothetical protein
MKFFLTLFSLVIFITFSCIAQKNVSKESSKFESSKTTISSCRVKAYITNPLNAKTIIATFSFNSLNSVLNSIDSTYKGHKIYLDEFTCLNNKDSYAFDSIIKNFNQEHNGNKLKEESNEAKELKKLSSFQYFSGAIYFSGQGFSTVLTIKANDRVFLEKAIARCVIGSIVTFENCYYKDVSSTKAVTINKSIKLK